MVLSHHAYLFVGERQTAIAQAEKVIAAHHPAHASRQERTVWNIEDSRQVSEQQSLKSWDSQPQFFMIIAEFFTLPAQQALLKVLEEPAPETYFLIICREANNLLPTLRSRCELNYLPSSSLVNVNLKWAEKFLTTEPSERLTLAAELINKEIERTRALELAETLALVCHRSLIAAPNQESATALEDIQQARDYLADPSSSIKLIFEHLALVLPRVVE